MIQSWPTRVELDSPPQERGVVVVLFSALILVFFAFAALAIDLSYAASATQQARSHAQLAALSALERYFFTDGSHEARLEAALERANEISKMNMILGYGSEIKELSAESGLGGQPILRPGRYFFGLPEDNSNPCIDGENVPCFVPYDGSAPVNAFQIEGNYYNDVTLRFASVAFGETKFPVNVNVTAAIVPRHGCFVVDLSRSMTQETHDGSNNFVYSYFNLADNPSYPPPYDSTRWASLNVTHPVRDGGDPVDPEVHYASDYQTMSVISDDGYIPETHAEFHPAPTDGDGAYTAGAVEKIFQVDLFRAPGYAGPEPLTTVFAGIDQALQFLESRAVVGDMACMIFYDQSLNWARVFKLTSDFDYLRRFTDLSVTGDPDSGLLAAVRQGLFPFADAKTNTLLGLAEAMTQLSSTWSEGTPSSDFIVLIGDGQTNCIDCSVDPKFDLNNDGRIDLTDYYNWYICYVSGSICSHSGYKNYAMCPYTAAKCGAADFDGDGVHAFDIDDYYLLWDAMRKDGSCAALGECSNSFPNYYFSMQAVQDYVSNVVVPTGVPIHVMAIGADTGPHSVDIADPESPGKCINESEKRVRRNESGQESNFDTVRGSSYPASTIPACFVQWWSTGPQVVCNPTTSIGSWVTKSEEQPFFQVNVDLYKLATMTGGIWAPIRPRAADENGACTPDECRPDLPRRMTDPLCRTPQEQVADYIDEIMGQNPFTLVEPRKNY